MFLKNLLAFNFSIKCLTIFYYIKIRPDKLQITRKKGKETVKNQGITQSFDNKFLF